MLDTMESGPFCESIHSFNNSLDSHPSGMSSFEHSWNTGNLDGTGGTQYSQNIAEASAESTGWFSHDIDICGPHAIDDPFNGLAAPNIDLSNPVATFTGNDDPQNSFQNPPGHSQGSHDNTGTQALPATTETLLMALLQRCLEEQRAPLSREIQGLALCEGVDATAIEQWLLSRLAQHGLSSTTNERVVVPASPADEVNANLRTQHDILRLVQEYARRKFSSECFSTHARKSADSGGHYECTSGCGYLTSVRDSWQRHEQLWQPQEFWYCVLCRGLGQRPVICSRKNKIFEHFEHCHKEVSKENHKALRDQSQVTYEAGHERACKFWNGSGLCRYRFKSWNDRIEHYLQHFRKEVGDGPWRLRYHRTRWFDDDDDPGKDTSPTSTTSSANSRSAGKLPARDASGSCNGSYRSNIGSRCNLAFGLGIHTPFSPAEVRRSKSRARPVLPEKLINVTTLSWSYETTSTSKYVALDGEPSISIARACLALLGRRQPGDELRELSRTCAPFKEACSIVGNMGYDFLWIDPLCESDSDVERMHALYEQAVLTIVLVSSPEKANSISHFTCHYSNIKRVRSWAIESLPILHVKILGRGAFGIVDEVRLGAAPDFYARKMLLGPKTHKLLKSIQFREIEIMQRLRHENIAEFVAAYVDYRSLNILMRPVAEYSLKDFLSDPAQWPEKLQHIPRWFCSLASAVSYMHSLSLRHKDIKPANILVRGPDVYLSDFGTAFDFSSSDSRSNGDGPMTPKYCAPEVARKASRGRKADIFSLGCVFLELATICSGHSLDHLEEFLGFGKNSPKHADVYCKRLTAVSHWLNMLLKSASTLFLQTAIKLCYRMMLRDPRARPTAPEVHRVLLRAACMSPTYALTSRTSLSASVDSTKLRPGRTPRSLSRKGTCQQPPEMALSRSASVQHVQKPYKYNLHGPGQVRLSSNHPGMAFDVLQSLFSLVNALEILHCKAAALLTIGEETPSRKLVVSNMIAGISARSVSAAIRPELHRVLKLLRLRERPRLLGIDAICVTQSDLPEGAEQMICMKRIYSHANSMIAVFEPKPLLKTAMSGTWHVLQDDMAQTTRKKRLSKGLSKGSVKRIISPKRFQSRWVFQELLLANELKYNVDSTKAGRADPWARLLLTLLDIEPAKSWMGVLSMSRAGACFWWSDMC